MPHRLVPTLAVLPLMSAVAIADPTDADQPSPTAPIRIALAVNSPLGWIGGHSLGASAYLAVTDRHVLRANVARYDYGPNLGTELIGLAAGGDGSEGSYEGHTTDAGLSWMLFPRALWDGFTVELGALVRARDTSVYDEYAPVPFVATDTRTVSGRGLIGWSWLVGGRAFLSLQVGGSVGYELGTETTDGYDFDDQMPATTNVRRTRASGEAIIRLGIPFEM